MLKKETQRCSGCHGSGVVKRTVTWRTANPSSYEKCVWCGGTGEVEVTIDEKKPRKPSSTLAAVAMLAGLALTAGAEPKDAPKGPITVHGTFVVVERVVGVLTVDGPGGFEVITTASGSEFYAPLLRWVMPGQCLGITGSAEGRVEPSGAIEWRRFAGEVKPSEECS